MSMPGLFPPARAAAIRHITDAMTAHPEMVAGSERICTALMARFGDRLFCKSGAAAFYAIGLKGRGIGIAVKMEGGASALIPPIVLSLLSLLGVITPEEADSLPEFRDPLIYNNHHTPVGRTELVPALRCGAPRRGGAAACPGI